MFPVFYSEHCNQLQTIVPPMKKKLFLLAVFSIIFVIQICHAQYYSIEPPILPLKTNGSVLFGKDIVISNLPNQNQQNLAICSAPNGWLYAAFIHDSIGMIFPRCKIMRSKDNGYNWSILANLEFPGGITSTQVTKLDILVVGENETDQRLIMADASVLTSNNNTYNMVQVTRWKCDPFTIEASPLVEVGTPYHNISLACDYNYPAATSNPHSVGFIYSVTGTKDSIIFRSSGDGGFTFDNHKVLAVTNKKFRNVSLAYGRSSTQNTGRYFAVWEEFADTSDRMGHIYTAHSNPNYNSPFITPIKLDGLDPSLSNFCRNPVIACQMNNLDNDSTDLSTVVVFEKYNPWSNENDIVGFYNMKSATGNSFNRFNVATTSNNEKQPSAEFNPNESNFMVTFLDSTAQKLPLVNKSFYMADPDNWNVVTPGYNDESGLQSPWPQVKVNHGNNQAIIGWTKIASNGKGIGLFDAPYIPPAGFTENTESRIIGKLEVIPNPCSNLVSIVFDLKKTERVVLDFFDVAGKSMEASTNQNYPPGRHRIFYNVASWPAGIYFCAFSAGDILKTGRICVIR